MNTRDLLAVARVRALALQAMVDAGGEPAPGQLDRASRPLRVAARALERPSDALRAACAASRPRRRPTVRSRTTPRTEP
jgi:hypothetical protein